MQSTLPVMKTPAKTSLGAISNAENHHSFIYLQPHTQLIMNIPKQKLIDTNPIAVYYIRIVHKPPLIHHGGK